MNTFTDDELKELKEDLSNKHKWGSPPINVIGLRCLLARLEAAERCAAKATLCPSLEFDKYYDAWKKSRGEVPDGNEEITEM